MPASAVRILIIGPLAEATGEMSQRLERHGWATHAVATLREAQIVLRTIRFPLVLASEKLDDGTGYELTKWATEQELTLMVGLQLTDTL
jgi:DNA-binding response OmpR family regulator